MASSTGRADVAALALVAFAASILMQLAATPRSTPVPTPNAGQSPSPCRGQVPRNSGHHWPLRLKVWPGAKHQQTQLASITCNRTSHQAWPWPRLGQPRGQRRCRRMVRSMMCSFRLIESPPCRLSLRLPFGRAPCVRPSQRSSGVTRATLLGTSTPGSCLAMNTPVATERRGDREFTSNPDDRDVADLRHPPKGQSCRLRSQLGLRAFDGCFDTGPAEMARRAATA